MKQLYRSVVLMLTVMLVTGCASTGEKFGSNEWVKCALIGAGVGGVVGSAKNTKAAVGAAALAAVVGALTCAGRDEDGDGVVDDKDQCPGTVDGAEVDQNGCELDFGGDGVPDRLDECPDTEAGAAVDARGCELDGDGDGVVNSQDQCPSTPAGADVDAMGCELDDDGDGVGNSTDQCPDTAANTPVDNVGCKLPVTYELEGINFDFDSARITDGTRAALDDALQIMQRHMELRVEIAGHTDSTGAQAYNQKLSERRAGAVRDYLVANGIDVSRLEVMGYGESQPVADNASREGRAANRRVEMRQL